MKGIIYNDKVVLISSNTLDANKIINEVHYDGYAEEFCTDISLNGDLISYTDNVEWNRTTFEIVDISLMFLL